MNTNKSYTAEDNSIVQTILRQKDFYKLFNVEKTFEESELKKAYRKIALKVHPDKNKAPKAEEAFKKISAAYDVLSTPDKKRHYDQTGFSELYQTDERREGGQGFTRRGNTYYYSGNIDPNDLFFN